MIISLILTLNVIVAIILLDRDGTLLMKVLYLGHLWCLTLRIICPDNLQHEVFIALLERIEI